MSDKGCYYCGDVVVAKGLCNKHYKKAWRNPKGKIRSRDGRYTSQSFEGLGIIKCVACGKPTRDHSLTEPCPMAAVR